MDEKIYINKNIKENWKNYLSTITDRIIGRSVFISN